MAVPKRNRIQMYVPRAIPGYTKQVYEARTAFGFVSQNQQLLAPSGYDMYVCHPLLDVAGLVGNVGGDNIRLAYAIPSLTFVGANAYWQNLIAQTTGADYWHTDGAADSVNNRLWVDDVAQTHWYVRPSGSLGARLSAYVVSALNGSFNGVYSDDATADIQNHYWNAWKTAFDGPTDAERPAYDNLWDQMQLSWLAGLKGIWQREKAVVANSAGGVYSNIDGITIEDTHIATNGEAWALSRFQAQSQLCDVNRHRYRARFPGTLNSTWNHPMQVPGLVMKGTYMVIV